LHSLSFIMLAAFCTVLSILATPLVMHRKCLTQLILCFILLLFALPSLALPHQQQAMNSQIVFIRDFSGNNSDLYQLDLSTSVSIQLTDVLDQYFTRYVESADCNVNRQSIIFAAGGNLYSVGFNGADVTPLVYVSDFVSPRWNANGDGIFVSAREFPSRYQDFYKANVDGSNVVLLRADGFNYNSLTLAPSGERIAATFYDEGMYGIIIMNTDGTLPTRMIETSDYIEAATWSPDGQKIAFASNRDGMLNIYTIRPDGSDVQQITSNSGNNLYPVWSQDGQWLAFSSDRDGVGYQIYIMNLNTTAVQRITGSEFENSDNFPQCWIGSYTPSTPTPIPTNTPTSTPT